MTTILITGVGRGIGHQLARQSLDKGWTVIGSVREASHADRLNDLAADRFRPLVFDVRDGAAVEAAASGVDTPIDILINCSGIIGPERQSVLDMDFDGFADTLAVNTVGPLRIIHAFLPHIRRSEHGRIVTLSSYMGSMSHTKSDRIAYRASKAAVNKVMQGLSGELRAEGIAVATAHPGWVRTDMGGNLADISVEESAGGVLELCEQLNLSNSGHFWNWDGEHLSW
ncbi:SDR family oxidoreductase [Hoeflea prorocentri]|uniref:SDR family oxidoreductase n=1 Tax=Hoeflea prorocentri TaxID=1922333 RepID=A0A9X3UG21_9HYPH|nr:SDR family oxidoreductase [Hoeflea prorocentri]MCY6379880.1 SDR family oxidoreductase [Hoeflea prorocentri]MDA5397680.1 SDR family oxidoreductase [Hoeflea prorocentri]